MSFSPQNFPSAKLLCSVSKVKPQPLLRVQSSCLSDIGKTSEEGNGSFERKFVWIKCSAFFLLIKAPQRNDLQYILSFRDTMRGIMRFLLKYSLSKKWQDINIVRRGCVLRWRILAESSSELVCVLKDVFIYRRYSDKSSFNLYESSQESEVFVSEVFVGVGRFTINLPTPTNTSLSTITTSLP